MAGKVTVFLERYAVAVEGEIVEIAKRDGPDGSFREGDLLIHKTRHERFAAIFRSDQWKGWATDPERVQVLESTFVYGK